LLQALSRLLIHHLPPVPNQARDVGPVPLANEEAADEPE
jgi:hypothetical protein